MRPLALLSLVLLAVALPLCAQQLPRNEVSVSYGRTNSSSQGNAPVAGAGYTRFWSRAVATRLAGFTGSETLNSDGGEKEFQSVYATAEFHAFRGRPVSPHVAAGVAYFSNRVQPASPFATERTESQFTTAVGGGVDLSFSPRLVFGVDALYMPFQSTPEGERFIVKLDPLTILGSVRFRW